MKPKFCLVFAVIAMSFSLICCPGCKPTTNRLDDIVKDLKEDSFSLSFEKTYPDYGITKTSYGAESFLAFADPQDVICPEPIRLRYPNLQVPVFQIPKIIQPTCPTMIPIDIATRVSDLLVKADGALFSGLKQIKLQGGNNVLLANEKFTSQYTSLRLDKIDDSVVNNVDGNKFLLLETPGNLSPGFTRGFYGYANLNDIVMKKNKLDIPHIFRPILIGCLDPQILATLRERLITLNPAVYKSLQVTPLQQDASVSVLSMPR